MELLLRSALCAVSLGTSAPSSPGAANHRAAPYVAWGAILEQVLCTFTVFCPGSFLNIVTSHRMVESYDQISRGRHRDKSHPVIIPQE